MNLNDLTTDQWQLGIGEQGEIVQGWHDVNQCLLVLLLTQKGSDPLRPLFGIDLMSHIDQPVNVAVPNLIKDIAQAVEVWETRATITKIEYTVTDSTVAVTVLWQTATTENLKTEISYELK